MNPLSGTSSQVERRTSSVLRFRFTSSLLKFVLVPVALIGTAAYAQRPAFSVDTSWLAPATASGESSSVNTADASLPDDPSVHLSAAKGAPQLAPQNATTAGPVAPKYTKYIAAGFRGQPITAHDKFIIGVRDLYSPFSLLGSVFSAGYSHVTNGEPNYGTNADAFGKRVGATFIRDASEGFFTDSILSPVFHEDPRYYVEGPRYNLIHRTLYAATRPIITRSDSGKSTLNAALLVGYAGASALSYTYYPAINQNFKDTAATFGGGLAGAAIGDFVSEFADQVLQALHLEKKP
jgi:hypothetical protein